MSVSFVDMLENESSRPQIPGINQLVYICPAYEIVDEPQPLAPDYVKLDHGTQDYTFVDTVGAGYFRRFQFTPQTGSDGDEGLGDIGTDGFKQKLEGILHGGREESTKFIQKIRNIGLIIIVRDNNGYQSVIGSKAIPAYMRTPNRNSQVKVGDTPGPRWKVSFECDSVDPAYKYEGTPHTTPNPTP